MRPPESFVGQPVRSLQTMLRVIGANDDSTPTVIPDGIYGPQTMTAVSAYQRNQGLPITGVADHQTWDSIVKAYGPARIEAEPAESVRIHMNPGQTVCQNQHWYFLPLMQAMLSVLSQAFPEIPCPSNSGAMDETTAQSLRAFQKYCCLPETGELNKECWKHLARQFTHNAARLERMSEEADDAPMTAE